MQWDDSAFAGFSNTTPWLSVNENYKQINIAKQEQDPGSVLHYFRKMTGLRKAHLALVYGRFDLVDEDNPQLFAYTRMLGEESYLVVLNFSDRRAILDADVDTERSQILIGNYNTNPLNHSYRPYEAVIYKL